MICHEDPRRDHVRDRPDLNGFDYAEVVPGSAPAVLRVYFLGKAPLKPRELTGDDLQITRDGQPAALQVLGEPAIVRVEDPKLDDHMDLTLVGIPDLSPYVLERRRRLVDDGPEFVEPYDRIAFSFQVNQSVDFDCETPPVCSPAVRPAPAIDYLAKDYASFRRLIFDRLALLVPEWTERHVPDVGVMLVDVMAYVADHLSYFQDAVATEAYLATARKRISVRRHARLVDYRLHEGSNARAFVTVLTGQAHDELLLDDLFFVTGFPGAPPLGTMVQWNELVAVAPRGTYEVFEPVSAADLVELRSAHNEIRLYDWGRRECCLPAGATTATLADAWVEQDRDLATLGVGTYLIASQSSEPPRALALEEGDFLAFEEVRSPSTGLEADADVGHRHVVRLTKVTPRSDPAYLIHPGEPRYPADYDGGDLETPVVDVEWATEDALPFALCLSALGPAPDCEYIDGVSVARGNVLLVDHGARHDQCLGCVPMAPPEQCCDDVGVPSPTVRRSDRYRPQFERGPLAFGSAPPEPGVPAARLLRAHPHEAKPLLRIASKQAPPPVAGLDDCRGAPFEDGIEWQCRDDLLHSDGDARDAVVEVDEDGIGHLRFGDGECGAIPEPNAEFHARYRVGGGPAGNVGAEAICYLGRYGRTFEGEPRMARNPLPAEGGTAPEPIAEAKLLAPHAFRRELMRAITEEDYATIAMRDPDHPSEPNPDVQRAAAEIKQNGNRYDVQVAIDPRQAVGQDPDRMKTLLARIEGMLETRRRIGHDVTVKRATDVPLEIELDVWARPSYLNAHVEAALRDVFSNRMLADGRLGFFHPDHLSLGESIFVSRLMAEAQAVDGVESVEVRKLDRYAAAGVAQSIADGMLAIGRHEVARLDNDPNNPGQGRITIRVKGGR